MKLYVLFSFLVSLNCFKLENITKYNFKKPIERPNIIRKRCFNIYDGKLVSVPCFNEYPNEKQKPVIYLYPNKPMDISVQLKLKNSVFTTVYPKFTNKDTWNVHAEPDGTISIKDRKYPYLFWEALSYETIDLNEGFVVTDKEAEAFLEEKLDILGLNNKEKTDFITYWLPVLINFYLINIKNYKYDYCKSYCQHEKDQYFSILMMIKIL